MHFLQKSVVQKSQTIKTLSRSHPLNRYNLLWQVFVKTQMQRKRSGVTEFILTQNVRGGVGRWSGRQAGMQGHLGAAQVEL